jgi:hypothetical protein
VNLPSDHQGPECFNIYELPWQRGEGPALVADAEVRSLSHDPETGSASLMVRLPAGWEATVSDDDVVVELFVLEGDLSANGDQVGTAGFIAVPKGHGSCRLSSNGGAQAYLWWSPGERLEGCYVDGIQVRRTWEEEWIPGDMPGLKNVRMYKPLRMPDPSTEATHGCPGGILHIIGHHPGLRWPDKEVHNNCWEEVFYIRGDNLMPDRGLLGPGTYLGNPQGFVHGVIISQTGVLQIRHTGGPVDLELFDYAGGNPLIERFLEGGSWIHDPVTEPWAERPEAPFLEQFE